MMLRFGYLVSVWSNFLGTEFRLVVLIGLVGGIQLAVRIGERTGTSECDGR